MKYPALASMMAAMIAVMACSNTFDFIERALEGPKLFFKSDVVDLKDSVKVYFKSPPDDRASYSFSITPDKAGALLDISVTVEGGAGILKAGNAFVVLIPDNGKLTGFFKGVKGEEQSLSFTPETEDEIQYRILFASRSTTGLVSKKNISTLILKTYKNLTPLAKFTLTPEAGSKFDYTLDASASLDQDQTYGGKIVVYQYTIICPNPSYSHTFQVSDAKIKYSFPSKGAFMVTLKANDNDGGIAMYEQKIDIQ